VHKSVLPEEVLRYLESENRHIILDGTVGNAGHAEVILERLTDKGRLIGIDSDKDALEIAEKNLQKFKDRYVLENENFRNIDKVLSQLKIDKVDGMLFDLGISSSQLEDSERGFSFRRPGPLDMRMDKASGIPLGQLLETLNEYEIGNIIREFGEERFWRRIARAIITERKKRPITNSQTLAEIIRSAARYSPRSRIDPATRTFQAFRIYINDELGALREMLEKAPTLMSKGARIVIISFHSLEDRLVKHSFKELARQGIFEILTKKPVRPADGETTDNPRARSARLRAAEKL